MRRAIKYLEPHSRAAFLEDCQRANDEVLREITRWLLTADLDDAVLANAANRQRLPPYNVPNTTVWLHLRPIDRGADDRVWSIYWYRPIDPADAIVAVDTRHPDEVT